ncbi:glycosyltransferase family 2 protein [Weissella confusa]|uniref:glycosyltransferase family 2 protein n=1 Tax=Weissella confusa TaxID=1583 RepID=UPI0005DDBE42|nr:glycosyltransferase family 2 protein [Weissella confusa]MDY2512980.1 glycosyltransferase family 2 protein [Weissella confusa]COI26155.1 glycosyl transferase family protein [Streptococcus pneumoniae]
MKKQTLSIVVPVNDEEKTIPIFVARLSEIELEINDVLFEYWFIDDGSKDDTLSVIKKIQKSNNRVHYISFSRNFGKESALLAGLQQATGDFVAVMDVDLQDPPELLPEMLQGVRDGEWDVVGSRRINRTGEPVLRSFFSNMFYKLVNSVSETEFVNGARDFRVMTRQVADAVLALPEYNRFSKGIFSWVGFRIKYLEFENVDRVAGKTSWSFWNLVKYSIEGIVDFSTAPLQLVVGTGIMSFLFAIIGIIFIIIRALVYPGSSVFGWPSLVVIILMIGGVQLISLGVLGRYISGVYTEVKHRPQFLVREMK